MNSSTLSTILKHFTLIPKSTSHEGKSGGVAQFIQDMMEGQKKAEIILYVVLWAILFATPVVSMLVGDIFTMSWEGQAREMASAQASTYDWDGVLNSWSLLAMFCVTFFVHNFFIAPLLVYRNHKWGYGIGILVLVVCFALFQLYARPHRPRPMDDKGKPKMERMAEGPDGQEGKPGAHGKPMMHPEPPNEMVMHDAPGKPDDLGKPEGMGKPGEMGKPEGDHGPKDHEHEPPLVFGGQDSVAFIIMTLLIGLNIGIKYFFKSLDDRKRMKELERENLSNQLAYLKYQINPHFFMNTLNNIHALVDIDSEQAKYTIEVLSKMMRYVLYEGNKSMAPIKKELDFLANYVELMRIRYTDKVRISVSLPPKMTQDKPLPPDASINNAEIPSMLLVNFVENAFKHGVSYQKESFIDVIVRIDETSHELEFLCNNSRKPTSEENHGGVGLRNTVKRLQLIYGKDGYDLHIYSNEEEYKVLLRLPIASLNS